MDQVLTISAFCYSIPFTLFLLSLSLCNVGFSTPMWTCHTSPMTTTTSSRVPSIQSTVPMTSLTRTFPKLPCYILVCVMLFFCLSFKYSLSLSLSCSTHLAGAPLTSFIIKLVQHTWRITLIRPFLTIRHKLLPMQLRPIFLKFICTTLRPSPRHCGEFARDAPQ